MFKLFVFVFILFTANHFGYIWEMIGLIFFLILLFTLSTCEVKR